MARSGIPTAPGAGPQLETIPRANDLEIPVVTAVNVGTWGYRAGVAGTPVLPAGARVLALSCIADTGGATITINGGNSIVVPDSMGFSVAIEADLFDPAIVFTGTLSYFVQYVVESAA